MRFITRQSRYIFVGMVILAIFYAFIPAPSFDDPYATILTDKKDQLLGALIADDGQWRFPSIDSIPEKYEQAVLAFEDKHFYYHPGVDPLAIIRALGQNLQAAKVVSGGSTITMQVVRLCRKGQARTIWEKIIEVVLVTKLELKYTKREIFRLYASHAPYGGNVVGLKAAAWRYFGRNPQQISWAEATLLAVLPNQPSLIHPGRNRVRLMEKRNRLLRRLEEKGVIDELTSQLAQSEVLPDRPEILPHEAPHLLITSYLKGQKGKHIESNINRGLQKKVKQIVKRHHAQLRQNEIYNAAVVVIQVSTGKVISYVGNTDNPEAEHGSQVDIITAPRSSGSILKPFLYASMLDEGLILPETLIPNIPIILKGFAPQNYSRTFDGAVHASQALARSLNIPAVHMLEKYGVPNFHHKLCKLGLTTINYSPSHYGLSLILGGAECTLWDISHIYGDMAKSLIDYHLDPEEKVDSEKYPLGPAAIWHMFEAMSRVNRPESEGSWELFNSKQKVAWKTGTSFGFRDAWAVGVTPKYVVGVWVGNADGEGRPGLVGVQTAAPILFDVFKKLPTSTWFKTPEADLIEVSICSESGEKAGPYCQEILNIDVPFAGLQTGVCHYHQLVHLDQTEKFRVNSSCVPVNQIVNKEWFVLPPIQEWYYRTKNAGYKLLPAFRSDCEPGSMNLATLDLIYPKRNAKIYIPIELNGNIGSAVFKAAHRIPQTEVFWHLDDQFIGNTKRIHQMPLSPDPGNHVLTLIDENGESLSREFQVLKRSVKNRSMN